MYCLGIDIGYGDVKVAFSNKGKLVKMFKFSSALGKAKRTSAIRDARVFDLKVKDSVVSLYVGEDALALPSTDIVDITDYEALETYAPAFLAKALSLAGIEPEEIDVVVSGLSVAQLSQSGYFKERLSNFTVNGKDYNFSKVFLLPQGAGSKLAFDKYGIEFPNNRTDTNSENFVGCDIGFNTIDLFYVTGGKTSPNLFEGLANEGVMRIAGMLQAKIKESFGKDISLREAKEVLGVKTYKLRGEHYDMTEFCLATIKEYQNHVLKLIEEKYGNILDKCDFVCFLGGGAKLLEPLDSFTKVVDKGAEFYNALGFCLYGETKV